MTSDRAGSHEVLLRTPEGLAYLTLDDRSLVVRVAAASEEGARRVQERVSAALPHVEGAELEVPVRLWWWNGNFAHDVARMIAVPAWRKVAANYVGSTRGGLDSDHGMADSSPRRPSGALARRSRHLHGQALSRLLNVCDGVLGQATRALIVVTTNEPLRSMHDALTRPGRCLADIQFERFGAEAAADWLRDRDTAPRPTNGSLTLAELFALSDGRPPLGRGQSVSRPRL